MVQFWKLDHSKTIEMPTLLIADNHQMMRIGLTTALEQQGNFMVVAQASTGREAIKMAAQHQPDVCIVDVNLPDMSGLDVCGELESYASETAVSTSAKQAVLMIATDDWDVYLTRAHTCGASGFLAKELSLEALVQAITAVAQGKTVFTPQQCQRVKQWQAEVGKPLNTLTDREKDVFHALLLGHTNPEIANRLHISIRTVESHVTHILQKLKLSSRRQLRRWAHEHHLVAGCF